jgi:septum formation protein
MGGDSAGLILASGSPQRRAILTQLGVSFEVVVPAVEELTAGPPAAVVVENARRKALRVAAEAGNGRVILACDTEVELAGRVHGKPVDADAAREMLTLLSGRTHRVLSGLCVIVAGRPQTACAVTDVSFRRLDRRLIDWYVETGEWRGRAGGYAIQGRGAALVGGIDGDYLNVVGLPVSALLDLMPSLVFDFAAISR